MKTQIKHTLRNVSLSVFSFLMVFGGMAYGQLPTDVPSPEGKPVDFFASWGSVIFYIVLPVAIVVLYIIWRRRNKREMRKKQEENTRK